MYVPHRWGTSPAAAARDRPEGTLQGGLSQSSSERSRILARRCLRKAGLVLFPVGLRARWHLDMPGHLEQCRRLRKGGHKAARLPKIIRILNPK